ncbi:hypothetical protein [Pseudarthrobacter sp. MM222]|uniref:hypothetical protein n=1 Tax=Pseudarthrobacter sp. MM222 TaxID=3018929 RepID=UPI0022209197|nr:hypothetical protein [Pseudarthrobacter sp. MM222]CAI3791238.1 hypothetical protein NKCBBBOE_00240 [Pseudarthrobacter sp. MM222]
MTGKDTEKTDSKAEKAPGNGQAEAAGEEAKGIKSRLTDAQKEMLASKSRGGTSTQSVGHNHKPTHASGKQGPAEKKVRW